MPCSRLADSAPLFQCQLDSGATGARLEPFPRSCALDDHSGESDVGLAPSSQGSRLTAFCDLLAFILFSRVNDFKHKKS